MTDTHTALLIVVIVLQIAQLLIVARVPRQPIVRRRRRVVNRAGRNTPK